MAVTQPIAKDQTDTELAAVKTIIEALQGCDPPTRMRVLRAAEALLQPVGPHMGPPQRNSL